jgi:1-acyl-sn-glycerol-3-phosphate acyltransferase
MMNEKNPDLSNDPLRYDTIKALFLAYFGVVGLEFVDAHHIPESGSAVIAANHVTNMDPFAIGQPTQRRVHFMGKKELFQSTFGKWFQESGNSFPVDRSRADLGAIKTAIRILKAGQLLVIFPQGTRGGKAAKDGVGFIALKGAAPIVPAGISLLPNWFGGKRYVIRYGQPIPPEGTSEELTSKVMAAIERLIEKPK